MTKTLFYIIVFSQIWLSIGSTFAHLVTQDIEYVELIGEEEKEKEKELEKEIEKIHNSAYHHESSSVDICESIALISKLNSLGRVHLQNNTPPPEDVTFFS